MGYPSLRGYPYRPTASHHAPVVSSGAGLTRVCWWWDPEDGTEASPLLVQADHLKRSGALISLTEPACVHTIDFNKLDDLPERHEASLTVKPGESKIGHQCDGVLLWWRVECSNADTCDESSTEAEAASIGPIPNTPFQDHWHSALYPIGRPLEINRQTAAAVTITMRCNDVRMRVSVERPSEPPQSSGGGKADAGAEASARATTPASSRSVACDVSCCERGLCAVCADRARLGAVRYGAHATVHRGDCGDSA